MNQITEEQFLADVRHEIESLKLHATEAEKDKLNFLTFEPSDIDGCIYGQLTGDCESTRAKELMDLSCKRVLNKNWKRNIESQPISIILTYVNGEYNGQDWYKDRGRAIDYISCLEGYIYGKDAKNEEIISYIKGKTVNLTL